MAATKLQTVMFPVAQTKRYRFLIEWAADTVASNFKVEVIWYNSDEGIIAPITLFDKAANAVNTPQIDCMNLTPPNTARYARITIEKPDVTANFAVFRYEFKEFDNSLEHVSRSILLKDEFTGANHGELDWNKVQFAGTLTLSKVANAPTKDNWSEFGVLNFLTSAVNGDGGVIHLGMLCQGPPPMGAEFRTKIRLANTTNLRAWAGIWSSISAGPDEALANTISGIGFRAQPAGSAENWFGVVRNGTTETTRDLGVTANTTWRDLGWYHNGAGIQFTVNGRPVGAVVTTNLPGSTTDLGVVFGVQTLTNGARGMEVDFFGFQTYLTRT